jgi:class 3 adenylate cyclase
VLVYFGYPQAHEDDAERAVRAGLELIAPVAALKTRTPLQTRVGISTGMVVVGDLIGSGSAQEQAVVGETPNLAARFESLEVLMACLRVVDFQSLGARLQNTRSTSSRRLRSHFSSEMSSSQLNPKSSFFKSFLRGPHVSR